MICKGQSATYLFADGVASETLLVEAVLGLCLSLIPPFEIPLAQYRIPVAEVLVSGDF